MAPSKVARKHDFVAKVVGGCSSHNSVTWPDPVIFFLPKIAQGLPHKVAQNPAALRAAVFSLSAKNLRGGGVAPTIPPVRARVNARVKRVH